MVKFPLGGIMFLRESLEEIDDFRVKRCRKFEFGPPSADTILRGFRNVNADKIEKVFIKWAHGIYEKVKIEPDRTIVAIDGKTMCGSNKVTGAKGIHIVSAWADELSLILGQVKTDEKELAKYGVIKSEKECNPDHGRIENRQYYLCTNLSWLENKDEWPGLKAVAMAREERTVNGKTSTDVSFFSNFT